MYLPTTKEMRFLRFNGIIPEINDCHEGQWIYHILKNVWIGFTVEGILIGTESQWNKWFLDWCLKNSLKSQHKHANVIANQILFKRILQQRKAMIT